jgi:hypothetical protein
MLRAQGSSLTARAGVEDFASVERRIEALCAQPARRRWFRVSCLRVARAVHSLECSER